MRRNCESELVDAARRGDSDALQSLIKSNYGSVFRYVLASLAYDREAAADISQEAFVGAVSRIKSFRGESSFRTWVVGIATNHIREHFRKGNRRPVSLNDVPEEKIGHFPDSSPESLSDGYIRYLVGRLPMGQRQALYLREFLGCTYDEIAVTLGITVGAAKNRVIEARRNMVIEARSYASEALNLRGSHKHANIGR